MSAPSPLDVTASLGNSLLSGDLFTGNLIEQVKESRLALDKTMANRILIG